MTLKISRGKGKRLNMWGNFKIQIYQQEGLQIEEQNICYLNPLFTIAQVRKQHDTGTKPIGSHTTHGS
jgi:hypothetical protein